MNQSTHSAIRPADTSRIPTRAATRSLLLDGAGVKVGAGDGMIVWATVGRIVVEETDGAHEGCEDGLGVIVGVSEGWQESKAPCPQ